MVGVIDSLGVLDGHDVGERDGIEGISVGVIEGISVGVTVGGSLGELVGVGVGSGYLQYARFNLKTSTKVSDLCFKKN